MALEQLISRINCRCQFPGYRDDSQSQRIECHNANATDLRNEPNELHPRKIPPFEPTRCGQLHTSLCRYSMFEFPSECLHRGGSARASKRSIFDQIVDPGKTVRLAKRPLCHTITHHGCHLLLVPLQTSDSEWLRPSVVLQQDRLSVERGERLINRP